MQPQIWRSAGRKIPAALGSGELWAELCRSVVRPVLWAKRARSHDMAPSNPPILFWTQSSPHKLKTQIRCGWTGIRKSHHENVTPLMMNDSHLEHVHPCGEITHSHEKGSCMSCPREGGHTRSVAGIAVSVWSLTMTDSYTG